MKKRTYNVILNAIMVLKNEEQLNEIIEKLIEILYKENGYDIENFTLENMSYLEKRNFLNKLMIERKPNPLNYEFLK